MKLLVLNGSPRKRGTVATLLRAVADGARQRHEVEWIDVYDLTMKPCRACMKCRPDGECCFPEDDAHLVGRKIRESGGLIVGTPTYWGGMSSQLKVLFDRIVPVLMGERPSGIPIPRHKGKPAIIATACTTPWPLSLIPSQGRGAIRAVKRSPPLRRLQNSRHSRDAGDKAGAEHPAVASGQGQSLGVTVVGAVNRGPFLPLGRNRRPGSPEHVSWQSRAILARNSWFRGRSGRIGRSAADGCLSSRGPASYNSGTASRLRKERPDEKQSLSVAYVVYPFHAKERIMPARRLKKFLDDQRVKYTTITHSQAFTAQEIAHAAHISGRDMAKTVIAKIDDGW